MSIHRLVIIGAAALILSMRAGHGGPCAAAVERMQDELDARVEAAIDTARFARDARRAFGLPPPPQGALAITGGSDDGGSWIGQAVAALAQAREADRSGDSAACEQALAEVQRAIGR
jgi:hypothetical protein